MVDNKGLIAFINTGYGQYYIRFMIMKMQLSRGKLVMIYTVNENMKVGKQYPWLVYNVQ